MDLAEKKGETLFRHPWEISRANSLLALARNERRESPYADIGSGDLYFANRLKEDSLSDIVAVDPAYKDNKPENIEGITTYSDISSLNKGLYGTVFLLDVVEHVEKDSEFIAQVSALLKPGGKLFLTVPAHRYLFSEHDSFLHHKRRYSKHMLTKALDGTGLEPENIFFFYFSLFFARLIEVLLGLFAVRSFSKQAVSDWKYPDRAFLTRLIVRALDLDFAVCFRSSKFKIYLPGLTLCAVCKKTSS